MRKGYRREIRGAHGTQHLVEPTGESIAIVNKHGVQVHAIIQSLVDDIVSRDVNNNNELRRALDAIAEEHYQLMTPRHQKIRDRLNNCVDYPLVKLLGILAAIMAAAASVVALVNQLST